MTNQEAIEVLKLNNPFMAGKDKENFSKAIDKGIEALENQKIGHWIKDEMSIMFDIWVCSECGGGGDKHFKYCPHCGAKMEGEKK